MLAKSVTKPVGTSTLWYLPACARLGSQEIGAIRKYIGSRKREIFSGAPSFLLPSIQASIQAEIFSERAGSACADRKLVPRTGRSGSDPRVDVLASERTLRRVIMHAPLVGSIMLQDLRRVDNFRFPA